VTGLKDHSYSNLSKSYPAHGKAPLFLGVISTAGWLRAALLLKTTNSNNDNLILTFS